MADEKEKGLYSAHAVVETPYVDHSHDHNVNLRSADKAAELVAGFHGEITEEEKNRVRRKIDWNLMPIL